MSHAPWFHWAAIIYGVGVAAAAVCLRELKLEIRPDGISYASLFCGGKSIQFSDISSAVVLTDPHYRNQWWPEFNWYDLVIMPKPETGKPPLKIAFLLFPSEAREQLIQLLAPEELDTGEA